MKISTFLLGAVARGVRDACAVGFVVLAVLFRDATSATCVSATGYGAGLCGMLYIESRLFLAVGVGVSVVGLVGLVRRRERLVAAVPRWSA